MTNSEFLSLGLFKLGYSVKPSADGFILDVYDPQGAHLGVISNSDNTEKELVDLVMIPHIVNPQAAMACAG